ncbi:MAG: SDR family oxidoreductase [Ferruginibacter sp.]
MKTIIITGASKGIGKATALQFAEKPVQLALIARDREALEVLKTTIEAKGVACSIYAGSVSDEVFIQATIADVFARYGKIDILVNNAGFGVFKPVNETSTEEWDAVFATNTKGTFICSKAVVPFMKDRMEGHIINLASDVAKRTFAGGALYCSSKYAQDAFCMALRKEMRPFNVKVSVIYSGLVDSYFHAEPQGSTSHEDWLKNEDMARAIEYIAYQPAHVVIDELMIHPIAQDY